MGGGERDDARTGGIHVVHPAAGVRGRVRCEVHSGEQPVTGPAVQLVATVDVVVDRRFGDTDLLRHGGEGETVEAEGEGGVLQGVQ